MAVLWISLAIVLLDQLTKFMMKGSPWEWLPFKGVPYGSSRPFIGDILRLTYIENPGIAWGITLPNTKVVFAIMSMVASAWIVSMIWRKRSTMPQMERIAWALVLGGAFGNGIDRIFYGVMFHEQPLFYGRVVDFIDFGLHRNWWPVFNIADAAVSCGVVLIIIASYWKRPLASAERSSALTAEAMMVEEETTLGQG